MMFLDRNRDRNCAMTDRRKSPGFFILGFSCALPAASHSSWKRRPQSFSLFLFLACVVHGYSSADLWPLKCPFTARAGSLEASVIVVQSCQEMQSLWRRQTNRVAQLRG